MSKRKCRKLFLAAMCCVVAIAAVSQPSSALVVNGYSSDRHDRFSSGYPASPVVNPNFLASSYDLSGIGWSTTSSQKSVAMISPQHFVASAHYKPDNSLGFLNRDGVLKEYTLTGVAYSSTTVKLGPTTYTSDLVLGTLASPIPDADKISYYPVPMAPTLDWYLGKELLVYGSTARMGRNTIDSFGIVWVPPNNNHTQCMAYDYDAVNGFSPDEAGASTGDSGSPAFMAWEGQLGVLGTHFAVGVPSGGVWNTYDSFIPAYVSQLNDAMSPTGYSVTTILVPEPGTLLLLCAGSLIAVLRRRRRRTAA